jgi:hypothetical protein
MTNTGVHNEPWTIWPTDVFQSNDSLLLAEDFTAWRPSLVALAM